jgi:hypothetical protein
MAEGFDLGFGLGRASPCFGELVDPLGGAGVDDRRRWRGDVGYGRAGRARGEFGFDNDGVGLLKGGVGRDQGNLGRGRVERCLSCVPRGRGDDVYECDRTVDSFTGTPRNVTLFTPLLQDLDLDP